MCLVKVTLTPQFKKSFKKLPKEIQKSAKEKDRVFRTNPFHPSLKTHRLKGELKDLHAYSINQQYRVLLEFVKENEIYYYDIGTHEIYR